MSNETITIDSLTGISIYAPGDGSLAVRNLNNVELDEDKLVAYINKYKPTLKGFLPFNENKGHPAYWRLHRPFTPLSDAGGVPTCIREDINGKVYKVVLEGYNKGDNFTIWNTKLLDMDGNEVHNHSLRLGLCFYLNYTRKWFESND